MDRRYGEQGQRYNGNNQMPPRPIPGLMDNNYYPQMPPVMPSFQQLPMPFNPQQGYQPVYPAPHQTYQVNPPRHPYQASSAAPQAPSDEAPEKAEDSKKRRKRKRKVELETTSDQQSLGTNLYALSEEARLRRERQRKEESPPPPPPSSPPPPPPPDDEGGAEDAGNSKDGIEEKKEAGFCRLTEEDFANFDEEWGAELENTETHIDDEAMKVRAVNERCFLVNAERYVKNEDGATLPTYLGQQIVEKFEREVKKVCEAARRDRPDVPRPPSPSLHLKCKCGQGSDYDSSDQSEPEEDDASESSAESSIEREVARKKNHPAAVSPEIAFNETGQANDGPLCRCSINAAKAGIRHGCFAGETAIPKCSSNSKLHHYLLSLSPLPTIQLKNPGALVHEDRQYRLEGFSIYLHKPLPDPLPKMPVTDFQGEATFEFLKEDDDLKIGTVYEMDLIRDYLFDDVFEFLDEWRYPRGTTADSSCSIYHIAPRYINRDRGDSPRILPLALVLSNYIAQFNTPLRSLLPAQLDEKILGRTKYSVRDRIVINPAMRPTSLRIDLVDVTGETPVNWKVTHFAQRPTAYTLHGRPEYQKAVRRLARIRKMFRNRKVAPTTEEKELAARLESEIARLDNESAQRRDKQVLLDIDGYRDTGLRCDMIHYALHVVLAMHHVRYHWSLATLESAIGYHFRDRTLIELAFTHSSYRKNYGQNPDHARNAQANLGIRVRGQALEANRKQPASGRRKGLTTLQQTMAREGSKRIEQSVMCQNERLEFLGDAVVEFMTTVHLYFCFPRLQEGGLATYRTALVQNRNLAQLAGRLHLDHWMLFAHGGDLCHEADMKHAMANAFEAFMAAVFLDGGVEHCDRIYAKVMFAQDPVILERWVNYPEHPLKVEHPETDRHLIQTIPTLQKLAEFEEKSGFHFQHIRLLAKAFTRRNVPMNDLTRGHNQRLEFLGDSVLQLIVSDFLYKHFPSHQEGHLSLLRTCLVSNNALSIVCDDLGLVEFLIEPQRRSQKNSSLKTKDKADIVEALIGAVYVDRGWDYCRVICRVCFFPRLKYFIRNDNWNDPKSRLQQACLALRCPGDAPIPIYRKISETGPTNTRLYTVIVSFRDKRLAEGVGSTVQLAEMDAAEKALETHAEQFRLASEQHAKSGRRRGGAGRREAAPPANKRPTPTAPRVNLLDLQLAPPTEMLNALYQQQYQMPIYGHPPPAFQQIPPGPGPPPYRPTTH
ncbi:unnamed protein product, partial [Mesorhabditis spiculigera]